MLAIKVHMCRGEVIVAACDHELLGRDLREGKKRLKVSESFYSGECGDEEMLRNRMANASIVNLVGERCIRVAVEEGYDCAANVITVEGIPHAQIVRL